MKVLLISPPTDNILRADYSDMFEEEGGTYPPIGLMYIAAYLQQYTDHSVEILDARAEGISYDGIKKEVEKRCPDIVGITTLTFTLLDVLEVAKGIKQVNERIHVNLGGPHPYIYPNETIKYPYIDSLTIGEGEIIFTELVKALSSHIPLSTVKGIVYKEGDNIIITEPRELIKDLDSLPHPARRLTDYKKYTSVLAKDAVITTMMTSRGCPYHCIYCHRPHLGKEFRARSAENVVDEMIMCVNLGINGFVLFDDTFTVDKKRVFDVCNNIIKKGLKIRWSIRARANHVDYEMLKKLKQAGCLWIQYGIEAGTEEILHNLRKGITIDEAMQAIRLSKQAGLITMADFMIGSPCETKENILKTIEFAVNLDPDYAQFTITTPYPATELYELAIKQGLAREDYWRNFASNPQKGFLPPVWNENLSRDELEGLLRLAYSRFYRRLGYVFRQVLKIRSFGEFKRKAAAGLKVLGFKS